MEPVIHDLLKFVLLTDKNYWYNIGKDDLQKALDRQPNLRVAKNVIFFLGDGMGVSTVTAARIHAGQKKGQPGEENYLNFEKFPNLGLLKVSSSLNPANKQFM